MTVYLDLVFFLNFCYDFFLLLTVDITLKRQTKLKRLIFAAIVGAISLVILFLPFNALLLFFFKVVTSLLMVVIAYGYKDLKYTGNNLLYLYMCSIILGGFLYFLNLQFSTSHHGLVFMNDGLSINYLVLLIIGPLILGLYLYQSKKIKLLYNYIFDIKIVFKDNSYLCCRAFLDSGNRLRDTITGKYVILVEENIIKRKTNKYIYVPYHALNKHGLIPCLSINYLEINEKQYRNYLVGITPDKFNIEGINCLLNNKLMEELC